MSSYMCCTSDRSSKVATLKESQSRFLWLDPTRWVEKRSKKEVGLNFSLFAIHYFVPYNEMIVVHVEICI